MVKQTYPFLVVSNLADETILKPMLPLTLSLQNQSVHAKGLLDTGADVNVLPYRIGLDLGLVWRDDKPPLQLSGNLGNKPALGVILMASIGSFMPVRLAFAWTQLDHIPLILGQVNFFMQFDVCFSRAETTFEIIQKV